MTTPASSNVVFDDIFTVEDIDREGRKFDRGALHSSLYIVFLYPLTKYSLVISLATIRTL